MVETWVGTPLLNPTDTSNNQTLFRKVSSQLLKPGEYMHAKVSLTPNLMMLHQDAGVASGGDGPEVY